MFISLDQAQEDKLDLICRKLRLAPGERFPRRAATTDPVDRDVRSFPHTHPSSDFETVGDIFSSAKNSPVGGTASRSSSP